MRRKGRTWGREKDRKATLFYAILEERPAPERERKHKASQIRIALDGIERQCFDRLEMPWSKRLNVIVGRITQVEIHASQDTVDLYRELDEQQRRKLYCDALQTA